MAAQRVKGDWITLASPCQSDRLFTSIVQGYWMITPEITDITYSWVTQCWRFVDIIRPFSLSPSLAKLFPYGIQLLSGFEHL